MSPSENWAPGEPKGGSNVKSSSQSTQKAVNNITPSTESSEKSIQTAAASVQSTQEPIQQTQGSFAVNNKNGKVHMVGKCTATKEGHKNQMTEPIYFNTYEEAEAYSKQAHPKQDKIQCGNCWK